MTTHSYRFLSMFYMVYDNIFCVTSQEVVRFAKISMGDFIFFVRGVCIEY